MRRVLLCMAVLCALAVPAALGSRLMEAERQLEIQREARLSTACEALDEMTLALEKITLTRDSQHQAALLAAILRGGWTARENLAAIPMDAGASAAALGLMDEITAQAENLLPALAGGALSAEALSALSTQQAACARMCAQASLARAAHGAEGSFTALSHLAQTALPNLAQVPVLAPDTPLGLPEGDVTQEEALALAGRAVGENRVQSLTPAPGASGVLPAHGVTVETPDLRLNVEITRQGGKLLWIMPETASFTPIYTRTQCQAAASAFLQQNGFPNMEEVAWQAYDGLYVSTLVPLQAGVLLYPDLVHMQVRMDTGEVVGFEAARYWTHHVPRELPQPALSEKDVASLVADSAALESVRLCLLPENGRETLCYEARLSYQNETYLVYLDAQSGRQITLRKLIADENGAQPA